MRVTSALTRSFWFKRKPVASRLLAVFAGVAVLAIFALVYFWFSQGTLLRPYQDSFRNGDISEWNIYGGSWRVKDGILENLSGERGDKAVTGSSRWTDYVVGTDIRLNADPVDWLWGDAGVMLRVTDPSIGVDSYDG